MFAVALREKDLAILRSRFARFPSINEVRVFGSRANGTARRASDLDLAVSAPGMARSEWADLCAELDEAPLVYGLDVVRLETLSNERLKARIAGEGIAIYSHREGI